MSASVYDSAKRPAPFLDELIQLWRYRTLVAELVSRDVKVRYKRSFLGVGWTMLHPLLTMLVMTAVFSTIFRFAVENYVVHVLAGLLLWNFLSTTTTHAMTQLAWGGDLLSRIYLPKAVFAVSSIGTGLVNIALALIPLFLVMALTGTRFSPALLFLPFPILLTALFALGVGLFISTQAVYFGDVVNMYEILLMLWFYLTPVIYPMEALPPQFAWVVRLNPMYYLVLLFRTPVLEGRLPDPIAIAAAAGSALVAVLLGWWAFSRRADEFPYRV